MLLLVRDDYLAANLVCMSCFTRYDFCFEIERREGGRMAVVLRGCPDRTINMSTIVHVLRTKSGEKGNLRIVQYFATQRFEELVSFRSVELGRIVHQFLSRSSDT